VTDNSGANLVVDLEQSHNLPLNRRVFEQVISLEPGVSVAPSSLSQSTTRTPTNPIYGNQNNYSVSGSRRVGAAFLGVAGTSLGVAAIAEVQVLTHAYSAQFGATGAAVNIASRSGTNECHGFALQALGTEGNVMRNSISGPGFFNVDSSIIERTKITENLDFEFRSRSFNLPNRANSGQPNQSSSLATPPRQIQFAIRLLF